jgi:hypothetical protein
MLATSALQARHGLQTSSMSTTPARQETPPALANPCLEITPSAEQYEQLCRDLGALRRAGAGSNTEVVIAAVRAVAADKLGDG